jgi:rhodanese-related sulfurtransferase
MTATTAEVDARVAMRFVSEGADILDVRDRHEWLAGHAPAAQHVPLPILPGARTPSWINRRVVVLCRSGSRAKAATALLRQRGVEAFTVSGGMNAWSQAGGPVVTDAGAPGRVA